MKEDMWLEVSLSEVCDIDIGGTPSRNIPEFWDTDNKTENHWVSIRDLNTKIILNTSERVTNLGVKNSNAKLVTKGTLLLSFKLSIGRVAFAGVNLYTNEAIAALKTRNIDAQFLYQGLQQWNLLQDVDQAIKGATLNKAKLKKLQFKVPALKSEQTRIAEILSTADEAITATETLIAKYSRIKTGLMQDLLTRGIDESGNIRSKATHRFVVKNGIEAPEEWEVDSLAVYCNLHNNLRKPISSLDRFERKGSFPYYGATGIIDLIDEYQVEGKFVLMGEDGDHFLKFDRQDMTHLVDGKFNVSNHAHILTGKGMCSTEWIHYFFCHRDITYYLTRQGAGRFKLNKASLLNLPVCVPDSKEQQRIISTIEVFNLSYLYELNSYSKLNSIKLGLMSDLLSGKVRVQPKSLETIS